VIRDDVNPAAAAEAAHIRLHAGRRSSRLACLKREPAACRGSRLSFVEALLISRLLL
jgi:hypothetical protein